MALVIEVNNQVTPQLQRIGAALRDRRGLHQAIADGARVEVRSHFATLVQSHRNRFGKRPTFWPRMRGSVRAEATEAAGRVVMAREVAQRFYGGTLRPRNGSKWLTIPAHPDAYGKRAGAFQDLVFIRQSAGARSVALLVRRHAKQRGLGEVFYVLVRKVHQRPDPSVLPTETKFRTVVGAATQAYLRRYRG